MSIHEAAQASLLAAEAWGLAAAATLGAANKLAAAWFGLCVRAPLRLALSVAGVRWAGSRSAAGTALDAQQGPSVRPEQLALARVALQRLTPVWLLPPVPRAGTTSRRTPERREHGDAAAEPATDPAPPMPSTFGAQPGSLLGVGTPEKAPSAGGARATAAAATEEEEEEEAGAEGAAARELEQQQQQEEERVEAGYDRLPSVPPPASAATGKGAAVCRTCPAPPAPPSALAPLVPVHLACQQRAEQC